MQVFVDTPDAYQAQLPEDRQLPIAQLRTLIKEQLPEGFEEVMSYGMIGYVVPHSLYPGGYHCDPKLPLPFMALASQKNFIALYHMGLYVNPELMDWFVGEYSAHSTARLDMGKSCIRFKKPAQIPYELIGQLAAKMTVAEWVALYESKLKK